MNVAGDRYNVNAMIAGWLGSQNELVFLLAARFALNSSELTRSIRGGTQEVVIATSVDHREAMRLREMLSRIGVSASITSTAVLPASNPSPSSPQSASEADIHRLGSGVEHDERGHKISFVSSNETPLSPLDHSPSPLSEVGHGLWLNEDDDPLNLEPPGEAKTTPYIPTSRSPLAYSRRPSRGWSSILGDDPSRPSIQSGQSPQLVDPIPSQQAPPSIQEATDTGSETSDVWPEYEEPFTEGELEHPSPTPPQLDPRQGDTRPKLSLDVVPDEVPSGPSPSNLQPVSNIIIRHNPYTPMMLSLCLPGAGQIYNGQVIKGLFFALTSWLIFTWIWSVWDAFVVAQEIEDPVAIGARRPLLRLGVFSFLAAPLLALIVWQGLTWQTTPSVELELRQKTRQLSVLSARGEAGVVLIRALYRADRAAREAGDELKTRPGPGDPAYGLTRRAVLSRSRRLITEGKSACSRKAYQECKDKMEAALALDPNNKSAWSYLVLAGQKLSNPTADP